MGMESGRSSSTCVQRRPLLGLLALEVGRRELFRSARAGLMAIPALMQTWSLIDCVLSDRHEAPREELPWETQADIDRRDFLRKTCNSLGKRQPFIQPSYYDMEASETGQRWLPSYPGRPLAPTGGTGACGG